VARKSCEYQTTHERSSEREWGEKIKNGAEGQSLSQRAGIIYFSLEDWGRTEGLKGSWQRGKGVISLQLNIRVVGNPRSWGYG